MSQQEIRSSKFLEKDIIRWMKWLRKLRYLKSYDQFDKYRIRPDARHQALQHIQVIPINSKNAVAIFVTNQGHTENKMFQFEQDVSVEDIKNCTDLLNDQLVGTSICDVVDKMREIEPMMAAKLVRHEVLFEAFVTAFMRLRQRRLRCQGEITCWVNQNSAISIV